VAGNGGAAQPAMAYAHRGSDARSRLSGRHCSPKPADVPADVREADGKRQTAKKTPAATSSERECPLRTTTHQERFCDLHPDGAKVSKRPRRTAASGRAPQLRRQDAWPCRRLRITPAVAMCSSLTTSDSYSDAGNVGELQYERHLSERGQKVDSISE